jgi:hypothetical protein
VSIENGRTMSPLQRSRSRLGSAVVTAALLSAAIALGASRAEAPLWCRSKLFDSDVGSGPFLVESRAAMDEMMAGMERKSSGDVDRDFAALMIPHHQGAIDMARAELRYGHDEQLRRIAQEIVVEQQQEIAAMRLAVGQSLLRSDP